MDPLTPHTYPWDQNNQVPQSVRTVLECSYFSRRTRPEPDPNPPQMFTVPRQAFNQTRFDQLIVPGFRSLGLYPMVPTWLIVLSQYLVSLCSQNGRSHGDLTPSTCRINQPFTHSILVSDLLFASIRSLSDAPTRIPGSRLSNLNLGIQTTDDRPLAGFGNAFTRSNLSRFLELVSSPFCAGSHQKLRF